MISQIKLIIVGLIALLLFVIAGAINDVFFAGPQLWGTTFPLSVVPTIFEEEIHWPRAVSEKFKIISGAFSDNRSKCNTTLFQLEQLNSNARLQMIIGKIDDLKYSEKCLKIIDNKYSALFTSAPEKTVSGLSNSYVLYIPWTDFNTRLVPKGKCLNIYGILKDTSYEQSLGENRAQIIEGEFDRIAFEVTPNFGIIRNYIKEIRFIGKQYGKLILLRNSNNKFAFVLYYSYVENRQDINSELDNLPNLLVDLKILK